MTYHISKRALTRLISFTVAALIVASIFVYRYASDAADSKRALQYHYMQSIDDLTVYSQNINSDLTKILYSNSPEMLSQLSSKLWREAGFAKNAISSLPVDYSELQNTNKLLSQVGDYCVSISKSVSAGTPITKEQRQTIEKLNKYSDLMAREIVTVSDSVRTGSLTLHKVKGNINRDFDKQPQAKQVADGFTEFEEGMSSYPTLIYDGPFSDHIMQKDAELLKSEKNVSRADAKKAAAKAAVLNESDLEEASDENSKMAAYCFSGKGVDVSITKKGGLVSYMLKSRMVDESKIDVQKALEKARTYMDSLGIGAMENTYYEVSNNIITFNYAYMQDKVIVYADLIKISVALDTGEIMGFDARGYIMNHKKRTIETPKYSKEVCQLGLSEYLSVEKSRLCIIPTSGLNEVLCYEFKCKSKDGKDILVYINANTKAEEQILILLINENGILTM